MAKRNLGRYQALATLALFYIALSAVSRLVLWAQFGAADGVPLLALPRILGIGLINDSVELLYLLAPFSLYLFLVSQRWHDSRWHKLLVGAGSFLTLFGMLYLAATEYFFFEEFDARFNLVAVDYLIYPHEVFIDIWQSYPVAEFLLIDGLLSAMLLWFLWPWLTATDASHTKLRQRSKVFAAHSALLGIVIAYFSTNTLANDDNRAVNELSINGISSFFQAAHTNELDYTHYYRTGNDKALWQRLTAELTKDGSRLTGAEGHLDRHHTAKPNGLGKLNVVVIVEESLGAHFVGAYGATQGLTPNFDKLAGQGLLFTRTYASGTRTVRGLEAITASLPPIPSESVLKRPGNEHIANWGETMRRLGYQTSFIYGGYGYFDNMNYFYGNNGFDIFDRSNIENPKFANIWGVSDEDLFDNAVAYFDKRAQEKKPFFSVIMSTSNHKPYTFPAGIPNVPTEGGGRDAGVRYADYAIGHLFDLAKTKPWYNNTVFVIVADHDARVYGKQQIPITNYEIPLLILAPGHLQPARIDTITAQIDIAPTVLGLLGMDYTAPFFGVDVLALNGASHPVFFNHNHDVALMLDDEVAVLGLGKSVDTYHYDRINNTLIPVPARQALVDLATAYYQTGFNQFEKHLYK